MLAVGFHEFSQFSRHLIHYRDYWMAFCLCGFLILNEGRSGSFHFNIAWGIYLNLME